MIREDTGIKEKKASSTRHVRVVHSMVAVFSALLIVMFVLALIFLKPPTSIVDDKQSEEVNKHLVSQLNLTSYCPSRMTLADVNGFGEAKPSEGDITASRRYSAFGPVYTSNASSLTGEHPQQLVDHDLGDGEQVQELSDSEHQEASIHRTQLLKAARGAGTSSSVVSWATKGDLSGVQATSCLTSSFDHSFLLPSTQRGWSQQLVLYNQSTKATSVTIQAYGTRSAGRLPLATSANVVVKAVSESVFDLSAALPDQDGLFISIKGNDAPVAAVVRVSAMSGTDSKGSDFIREVGSANKQISLAGIEEHDHAELLLKGEEETPVQLAWSTPTGPIKLKQVEISARKVSRINLGEAPQNANGLLVQGDKPLVAAVQLTRTGALNQSDFTVVTPTPAAAVSAVTLPENSLGRILVMNPSASPLRLRIDGFDGDGKYVADKQLNLDKGHAEGIDFDQIGAKVSIVRLEVQSGQAVWNVRVGVPTVAQANQAGLAVLQPSSLMPQSLSIQVKQEQGIVD